MRSRAFEAKEQAQLYLRSLQHRHAMFWSPTSGPTLSNAKTTPFCAGRFMTEPFRYTYREIDHSVTIWEMSGQPDPESWGRMLEEGSRFLAQLERRGKQVAIVVDPSGLSSFDGEMRKATGQWRVENMALIANVVPCASYVAQRAWIRGAITAIFWIAPPVVPVGVKASREEALDWVASRLAPQRRIAGRI